jgi:hypothetical protein
MQHLIGLALQNFSLALLVIGLLASAVSVLGASRPRHNPERGS